MINAVELQKLLDKAGTGRIRIHGVGGKVHRVECIYKEERVIIQNVLDKLEDNESFFTLDGMFNDGLFSGEIAIKHQ